MLKLAHYYARPRAHARDRYTTVTYGRGETLAPVPITRDNGGMTTHTATVHHYADQSGEYTYTVQGLLFTVEHDGDTQLAAMRAWRDQELDTCYTPEPLDDMLTVLDGGAIIYGGVIYSLDWSLRADINAETLKQGISL